MISASRSGYFRARWGRYPADITSYYWLITRTFTMHILDSFLAFSAYFFIGVAMVIIFLFIYSKITPHNEWQLIKNNNTAAALAFSGTLLGYVIPYPVRQSMR